MRRKITSMLVALVLCMLITGCRDGSSNDLAVNNSMTEDGTNVNQVSDNGVGEVTNNFNPDDVGKTFVEGEYEYTVLGDGTAKLIAYSGTAKELRLPEILNGYPISVIGTYCMSGNDTVVELTVPGTVKILEKHSISGALALKDLVLEEGVEVIEFEALPLWQLTSLDLPSSLVRVDEYLASRFESRDLLECYNGIYYAGTIACGVDRNTFDVNNVTFKDNTTGISGHFWMEAENDMEMQKLVIPNGVKFIGEAAFYEAGYRAYEIPDSVKGIGYMAIGYTEVNWESVALTNLKIYGKANTEIERYAKEHGFTFVTIN